MKIFLSSLFSEPGINFDISHKVLSLIKVELNKLELKNKLVNEKNYQISLMISTSSMTNSVNVRGPSFDRRNKILTYGLWLPYLDKGLEKNEYLNRYLDNLFESICILLKEYGVGIEEIENIKIGVKKIVQYNPEYNKPQTG